MTDFFENRLLISNSYYRNEKNNNRKSKWITLCCSYRRHEQFRKLSKKTQYKIINDTEHGCYIGTYKKSIKNNITANWNNPLFVFKYNQISQRIQFNLEEPSLVERIISGELKPELLATYDNKTISSSFNHIYKEIEERKKQKIIKKVCKGEICKMCGCDESTFILVQIRALDEGQTMKYTCANESCGNEWFEGGT